jgi:hypothetical protein
MHEGSFGARATTLQVLRRSFEHQACRMLHEIAAPRYYPGTDLVLRGMPSDNFEAGWSTLRPLVHF